EGERQALRERVIRCRMDRRGHAETPRFRTRAIGEPQSARWFEGRERARSDLHGRNQASAEDLEESSHSRLSRVESAPRRRQIESTLARVREVERVVRRTVDAIYEP